MKIFIFIVAIIVSIGLGVTFYINFTLKVKSKCEKQVQYIPAKGAIEGINGGGGIFGTQPSESAHFSWGSSKFESREVAIKSCIKYNKNK